MQAYFDSEPHLGISARLDHSCDDATFVPGEEAAGAFRSVQAGSARLIGPLWTLPYCGELLVFFAIGAAGAGGPERRQALVSVSLLLPLCVWPVLRSPPRLRRE